MLIQMPQIPILPKKEIIFILSYVDKMFQIVKTRLNKTISKHVKFCKLSVIFQISNRPKNYFRSKIFLMKHYGQVLFINFSAEAAQHFTLVRPIDISR